MSNTKRCIKCRQSKTLESFGKSKGGRYGRASQCKQCRSIYFAEYRKANSAKIAQKNADWYVKTKPARQEASKKYRNQNKEQVLASKISWAKNNPDKVKAITARYLEKNKVKVAQRRQEYLDRNSKRIAERAKHYREMNKELVLARQQSWRQRNPEAFKQYNNLRRARKLANKTHKITKKEIAKLLARPCVYCGAKSEHIDHILPLSRGGSHSIGNLVGACAQCNLSKSDKTVMEWRASRL